MTDTLTTHRLTLRPPRMADAPRITGLVNDPRIYRNVSSIPPGQTLEQTEAFLARSIAGEAATGGHVFAVEHQGELIGMVGAGTPRGPAGQTGALEVGYWLAPTVWGQGLATEAASAVVGWLERVRHRFVLTSAYFTDNPASGRVLRKLGFLPAGRAFMQSLGRGERVETIEMVRIADAL